MKRKDNMDIDAEDILRLKKRYFVTIASLFILFILTVIISFLNIIELISLTTEELWSINLLYTGYIIAFLLLTSLFILKKGIE